MMTTTSKTMTASRDDRSQGRATNMIMGNMVDNNVDDAHGGGASGGGPGILMDHALRQDTVGGGEHALLANSPNGRAIFPLKQLHHATSMMPPLPLPTPMSPRGDVPSPRSADMLTVMMCGETIDFALYNVDDNVIGAGQTAPLNEHESHENQPPLTPTSLAWIPHWAREASGYDKTPPKQQSGAQHNLDSPRYGSTYVARRLLHRATSPSPRSPKVASPFTRALMCDETMPPPSPGAQVTRLPTGVVVRRAEEASLAPPTPPTPPSQVVSPRMVETPALVPAIAWVP